MPQVEKILKDALATGAEDGNMQLIRQRAREVRRRVLFCLPALAMCAVGCVDLCTVWQVEEALYANYKSLTFEYTEKAKTLKYNIANNKELRDVVLSAELGADDLVTMKNSDLADRAKKSEREVAKAESLQEIINNEEFKNLKDAAAGLSLRKTDAGLAVVDIEADKAKKEAEDSERRKLEEQRTRAKADATKKEKATMVNIDTTEQEANTYVNNTWKYTPKGNGGGAVSDDEDENPPTEPVISSPVLDSQPTDGIDVEYVDGMDGHEEGYHEGVAWDGELDVCGKKKPLLYPEQAGSRPLRLSAFPLQEEGELHNRIFQRVQVQGYIGLGDMEKYIEAKRKSPQVKMVLAYKLVPRQNSRSQYDVLLEELNDKGKGMCLIDDRSWGGLLYALPSSCKSVRSLLAFNEDECIIAVAITDLHKPEQAPKRHQPDDMRLDVTNDYAKATGSTEKTVMLKLKKGSCNLRLRTIAGDVELDKIPDELKDISKGQVDDVINFLLTQKVSVMEVEPEREADEDEHLKILEYLVEKKRAAVVLDTEKALMYLIPPVDAAGKLLDPPATTCDNLLGVLLLSETDENIGQDSDKGLQKQETVATATVPAQPQQPGLFAHVVPTSSTTLSTHSKVEIAQMGSSGMAAPKLPESGNVVEVAGHWQQQQGKNLQAQHVHIRAPAPISVPQRHLGAVQQQPPYPSPRPSYDLQSPSIPAAHAAPMRDWGTSPQRGHDEGRGGWQGNSPGYQAPQARFVGDDRQDPRQWQERNAQNFHTAPPQNTQNFHSAPPQNAHYGGFAGGGQQRGAPYNGYEPGPPLGGEQWGDGRGDGRGGGGFQGYLRSGGDMRGDMRGGGGEMRGGGDMGGGGDMRGVGDMRGGGDMRAPPHNHGPPPPNNAAYNNNWSNGPQYGNSPMEPRHSPLDPRDPRNFRR